MPCIGAQVAGAFVGAPDRAAELRGPHLQGRPQHQKPPRDLLHLTGCRVSIWTVAPTRSSEPRSLVAVIFALTSAVNNPPLSNMGPLVIGFLVVAIGLGWGANARLRHQPGP